MNFKTTNTPAERLLLSVHEAATMLGVSRATIFRQMRAKRLQTKKIGRRTLIPRAELARYIAALA